MASHRSPHFAKPDDTDATNDTLPHVPTLLLTIEFTHCRRNPDRAGNGATVAAARIATTSLFASVARRRSVFAPGRKYCMRSHPLRIIVTRFA
jgi:hypothetical protein